PGEPRLAADGLRAPRERRDLQGGPRRRRRRLRLVGRRQPPLQGRQGARRRLPRANRRRRRQQRRWRLDRRRVALAEAGGVAQGVGLVRLLPGEVVVLAAEVAVGRGLLVDRPVQVEVVAERAGTQVEVLLDELRDLT